MPEPVIPSLPSGLTSPDGNISLEPGPPYVQHSLPAHSELGPETSTGGVDPYAVNSETIKELSQNLSRVNLPRKPVTERWYTASQIAKAKI